MSEEYDYRKDLAELSEMEDVYDEWMEVQKDIEALTESFDSFLAEVEDEKYSGEAWEITGVGPGVYVFKHKKTAEFRYISREYIDKLFKGV